MSEKKIENTESKILIIGDSLSMHQERLIRELEEFKDTIVTLGVSAQEATTAFKALAKMDYSNLETIMFDSISEPKILNDYPYINESAPISKKAWKKLNKKIKKQCNIEPETQAEIWGNKWDKKIKRNL